MDPRVRRILVTSEREFYGARAMQGIRRFASDDRRWAVVDWSSNDNQLMPIIARSKPDGVILRRPDPQVAARLAEIGIPAVAIDVEPDMPCPGVGVDDPAVGRMAAEYLLSLGPRHFAFCGYSNWTFSRLREAAFCQAVEQAQFVPERLRTTLSFAQVWDGAGDLAQWLDRLPRPVAILACHDPLGIRIMEACHDAGLSVPGDVAVLSVDNASIYCEWMQPRLSSIETAPERIGYEACALLERMLNGLPPPADPLLIPPVGVTVRQSTDLLASTDAEVAAAVRFIRDNAHRPLQVDEVVDQTCLSRKALEVRFRKVLARTPLEEIERAQVERAKELLLSTDLRISDVARRCGCPYTPRLSSIFRRVTGQTPSDFRESNKGLGATANGHGNGHLSAPATRAHHAHAY